MTIVAWNRENEAERIAARQLAREQNEKDILGKRNGPLDPAWWKPQIPKSMTWEAWPYGYAAESQEMQTKMGYRGGGKVYFHGGICQSHTYKFMALLKYLNLWGDQ